MKFSLIAKAITVLISVAVSTEVLARGQYLPWWSDLYPESRSDEIPATAGSGPCQLCHTRSEGGNGWNYYGWSIRVETAGATNISRSELNQILFAIELNSSNDAGCASGPVNGGFTFLDKLRHNAQPGWTEGSNNVRLSNNTCSENQNPLSLSAGAPTSLDLPAAIDNPIPASINVGGSSVTLYPVATDFNSPVAAVRAPGIDGSLFVVEQRGKIMRVDLATGAKTLFLDIESSLVRPRDGFDERGLLGLAFHPNFATNGLFYTYESRPFSANSPDADYNTLPSSVAPDHQTVIVEYRASDASCNSSVREVEPLLVINQPQFNHNGGDLHFGPDGFLYISVGDGGGANDNQVGHGLTGNGRNIMNPLGAILRIDINAPNSNDRPYGIPLDNPFAQSQGVDEIFAYGLRNPYRMSFDALTGELYAADVGQNQIEEINKIVNGGNYGWSWREGTFAFYSTRGAGTFVSDVDIAGAPTDLIDPIAQYDHDEGVSITGGYVYRGNALSSLNSRYVFADYAQNFAGPSGRLFSLNQGTGLIEEIATPAADAQFYSGFGQDSENELYVLGTQSFDPLTTSGTLFKLMPVGAAYTSPDAMGESAQCPISDELCVPIKVNDGGVAVVCL